MQRAGAGHKLSLAGRRTNLQKPDYVKGACQLQPNKERRICEGEGTCGVRRSLSVDESQSGQKQKCASSAWEMSQDQDRDRNRLGCLPDNCEMQTTTSEWSKNTKYKKAIPSRA